jgi:hypothetical protein
MPHKILRYLSICAGILSLLLGAVFLYPKIIKADITTGLVGYWNFNEGSGTTAADSSGNNNNGTISGATWTTGKYGNALNFNGSAGLVSINKDIIGSGATTISAWVYLNGYGQGGYGYILANGPAQFYTVGWDKKLAFTGNYNSNVLISASNSIQLNQWVHVTITRDNLGTANVYINGTLNGTANQSSGTPQAGGSSAIGNAPSGSQTFNGLIDEVRIYNRALSASEVLELYNYTGGGTPTPSVTPTSTPSATPSPSPTPDTTPPVRSSGSPSGTLPAGTTQTTISLSTNENATCKYSTIANTSYASMSNTFSTTGTINHSATITGLQNSQTYSYYIRCLDTSNNANPDDYTISFSVSSQASGEIIPQNRRVIWQGNVGVKINGVEGIPTNTDQVDCTKSPYNVPTDGISDAANAIQACVNGTINRVAYLPAGTYMVSHVIRLESNKILRGAGMGQTIIKGMNAYFGSGILNISTWMPGGWSGPDGDFRYSTAKDISSGNTKGSTRITTTQAHGYSVGDLVVIDQEPNPTADPPIDDIGCDGSCTYCGRIGSSGLPRVLNQIDVVTNIVNANTFDIDVPLVYDFTQSPQVIKFVYVTRESGIENLTVDLNLGSTYIAGIVHLEETVNCWLKNVEVKNLDYQSFIALNSNFRTTITGCYVHTSLAAGGQSSHGYGVAVSRFFSSNLLENNIVTEAAVGFIIDAVTGNVLAYNYFDKLGGKYFGGSTTQQSSSIMYHGAQSMMNLMEGNYSVDAAGFSADWYHGSTALNTYFRSKANNWAGSTYNISTVFLFTKTRYYNVVGNVLDTSSGYNCGGGLLYQTNKPDCRAIYTLDFDQPGYAPNGCPPGLSSSDGTAASTILRHGNWDNVNNAVVWDPNISNHTLPASLYLSAKPAWWGSLAWPPIGPDLNPMVSTIPAQQRYIAMTGGDTTPPAAPAGVAVQ